MNALGSSQSLPFSHSIYLGLQVMSDTLAIFLAGFVIYAAYLDWNVHPFSIYLAAMVACAAMIYPSFYVARLYSLELVEQQTIQVRRIVLICTAVFLALIAMAFALKISSQFSRVWVLSWFLLSTLLIALGRTCCHFMHLKLARLGRLTRNVVIVGADEQGKRLIDALQLRASPWFRVQAFFDDRTERVPATIGDYHIAGGVDDLIRYAREYHCDDIIIALPWSAEKRILAILEKLKDLPANVRLGPDLVGLNFLQSAYSRYNGVLVLNVLDKPLEGWKTALKTVEDRALSALFLLLAFPVMLVIAVLIKLDSPGPVFFRQRRYGFNNHLIYVLKFRTMYADQQDEAGTRLTTNGDKRVTRIGAILRRTSLDELPQLINVLRGEMSLVGPRPHAIKANVAGRKLYEEVVSHYAMRHNVKPGITGWAQVNGWRGETDTDEKIIKRVEHDLYYVSHWSLFLDMKILLLTVGVVLSAHNAC